MEDFVTFEIAKKLKEKGFPQNMCNDEYGYITEEYDDEYDIGERVGIWYIPNYLPYIAAPTIYQVLKWIRKDKNIDVEIHADVGMLGYKVYVPYISTYTEFHIDASDDVVRYRQKKFNPTTRLPHEIIPAHVYFNEWEEAAIAGIEYVLDKLI